MFLYVYLTFAGTLDRNIHSTLYSRNLKINSNILFAIFNHNELQQSLISLSVFVGSLHYYNKQQQHKTSYL